MILVAIENKFFILDFKAGFHESFSYKLFDL